MAADMAIKEREDLVSKVRKVIKQNPEVNVYASLKDLEEGLQASSGAGRGIGTLKSEDKMLLTGLTVKLTVGSVQRNAVQICGPLSGWIESSKITDQL
jgi:hypothetical protein